MSHYGRFWEKIQRKREQITALVPSARTGTYASAKEDVERHCAKLRLLLDEWKSLEDWEE